MKHQSRIVWILSLLLAAAPALAQKAPPAPTGPSEGERALAERFAALGQDSLRQGRSGQPVHQQAAALLQAATRLDPNEPRHWRLLADVLSALGELKPTRDAMASLLRLNPSNPSVYVQLMHLYLADMQAVDARMNYLLGDVQHPGIVKRDELPAQVRSEAAAIAAQLSIEQGALEQARLLIARSLELNPVNPLAAELNWNLLQDSEDEVERTRAILALVQAQPAQVRHVAALARQLAQAGFLDESLTWFGAAAQLGQATGSLNPQEFIADWAAVMFVTNNPFEADELVKQLLAANPEDVNGLYMRLLLDRNSGNRQAVADSLTKARAVLLKRLHALRVQVGLIAEDAQFDPAAVPDLAADLPRVKADDTAPEIKAAYATAIHDLLWLELYFQGPSQTTARLLEALRAIVPADSVQLARLEGWSFLLQGKTDEARVKLSAAAERDPLAALGLLRMVDRGNDQAMQKMTEEGRKLLSDNPSGLVGAFLVSELRPFGVRPEVPESSRPIARKVADFSRDWPLIYSDPNSFYQIRARVIGIAHPVGKPMIAEIEIKNVSAFDLSIAEVGAIHPTLWFNARLSGVINQELPGVAADRLLQGLVLPARQTLVQHIRLDQGSLRELLMQYPHVSIQIMFSVMTNPTSVQNEKGESFVIPGMIGQARDFQNLIERVAMPVQRLEQQAAEAFRNNDAVATLNVIDLIRAYLPVLEEFVANAEKQVGNPATGVTAEQVEALRQLGPQLHLGINRKMQEPSRPVRAWAAYTLARLSSGDEQAEILRQMRAGDDWATKMLSLVALQSRPAEEIKEIAGRLTGENEDPLVRRMAEATIAVADLPPATQPAAPTGAATAPAGAAGTPATTPTGN